MNKILDYFFLSNKRGIATLKKISNENSKQIKNGGLEIAPSFTHWNGRTSCKIVNLPESPNIMLSSNNVLDMIKASGVLVGGKINDTFTLEFDASGDPPRLVSEKNQRDRIERISEYTKKILDSPMSKKLEVGHLYGTKGSYFICLGYKVPGLKTRKTVYYKGDKDYFPEMLSFPYRFSRSSWSGWDMSGQESWNLTLEIPDSCIELIPHRTVSQLSSSVMSMLINKKHACVKLRLDSFYRKAADLGKVFEVNNPSQLLVDSMKSMIPDDFKDGGYSTYYNYQSLLNLCLIYYCLTSDLEELRKINNFKPLREYFIEEYKSSTIFDEWIESKLWST